ncbi:MAG: PAS domain-containing protein [Verrucomicrobia bacterium]|nr:PAS domain-containing protein [Verrucomicrobiota bacterium]
MPSIPAFSERNTRILHRLKPLILALVAVLFVSQNLRAQNHKIDHVSPDLVEAGIPAFKVLGSESMGLDSPPTDIRLMPDGRILVVAARQLALGDGVRWEVFRQSPTDLSVAGLGAVVDRDGCIYVGTADGAARVEFGSDGFWRLVLVSFWSSPGATPKLSLTESIVTEAGGEWYWHSLTGPIVSWRPGGTATLAGHANSYESIFHQGDARYLSDRSNGALTKFSHGRMTPVKAEGAFSAITCAQPFDRAFALVGTYGLGLQLFDGQTARNFPADRVLDSGARINDLCTTDGGFFAAAVDNYGIVFFSRDGRTVQTLDRSLDQRLARVKRLVPVSGGGIWGLMDGGILHIEFPSCVSHFEPRIGAGITTAYPFRLNGRLWLLADGKTYRGNYDADGRLLQLERDGPARLFVDSFSGATGLPVAGTEGGAFYRAESGWVAFAPTINHLRIIDPVPVNGRWLYSALNEIGWLQLVNGAVAIAERIPVPYLGNAYNKPVKDAQGRIWLEQGIGQIARIQCEQGKPTAKTFSKQDGLPESWPQIFELDGTVHFNFSDKIFRFDDSLQRFVPDKAFVNQLPGITSIFGRPGLDAKGRLWATVDGAVRVFERKDGQWSATPLIVPLGFQPYYYTFESNGVVWMHAQYRLARYDPAMPVSEPMPLRALITHITLTNSDRSLFNFEQEIPPLDFSENSLIVHFVLSGNKFAAPVNFEVKLEGSSSSWVSVGSSGSAVFNRLKEGNYILHVRPRADTAVGEEAAVSFSIRPPWHRTTTAYVVYVLSLFGFVLLVVALLTKLERRENVRLEHLVKERTRELTESSARYQELVEHTPDVIARFDRDVRYLFINSAVSQFSPMKPEEFIGKSLRDIGLPQEQAQEREALVRRIFDSGKPIEAELELTVGKVPKVSHWRGYPEFDADGRVQSVLTINRDITERRLADEAKAKLEAQLFQSQKLEAIGTLAGGIAHDFNNILAGITGYTSLAHEAATGNTELLDYLNEINRAALRAAELVRQILAFSRSDKPTMVPLQLRTVVTEVARLLRASIPSSIEFDVYLAQQLPAIQGNPTQLHQVVMNLGTNAWHAMRDKPGKLSIRLEACMVDEPLALDLPGDSHNSFVRLSISDTGCGMDAATQKRAFEPFFTTKGPGEGTGLGLSVVHGIVHNHRGTIRLISEVGRGTTFEIYFPALAAAPVAKGDNESGAHPRGHDERILLVDDEESLVRIGVRTLCMLGYAAEGETKVLEALARLKREPNTFQLVITDQTMPSMSGLEFAQHIRDLRADLPVVLASGNSEGITPTKVRAAGVRDVLSKPYNIATLAKAVGRNLHSGPC